MMPLAGQIFEKMHFLELLCQFGRNLLPFSSRGLAGVLPPAGQMFEKLNFLKIFDNFGEKFCSFQAGV